MPLVLGHGGAAKEDVLSLLVAVLERTGLICMCVCVCVRESREQSVRERKKEQRESRERAEREQRASERDI